jgi:hypothetical protein
MNKNRAGGRIFIKTGKRIVSEKNTIFLAGPKLLQTSTARTIACGKFNMSRMAILRGLERIANGFCERRINR